MVIIPVLALLLYSVEPKLAALTKESLVMNIWYFENINTLNILFGENLYRRQKQAFICFFVLLKLPDSRDG